MPFFGFFTNIDTSYLIVVITRITGMLMFLTIPIEPRIEAFWDYFSVFKIGHL